MAAALIETVRLGQKELSSHMLVEAGLRRGWVDEAQLARARNSNVAGAPVYSELVDRLLDTGNISAAQLQTLREEAAFAEILETVTDSEAPEEVRAAAELPDRRVGRYILSGEIGAGGMGVVWRAWDTQLSRWVAVKQLKVNDAQLVSRFMREASLLARLSHPHITAVYEIGVSQGQPFLVMELVEGGSPKAADLSREQAAAVIRDAARAVQYAHDQGIIHRDLKPSNLLVDKSGRVFVTDFGLARMRESSNDLTASGSLLGTPAFMASEQAQGKEADHRTDVYGLGASLYALLSGEPPFTGEIVHELVKRVAVSNPPTLNDGDDLAVIVQKAMERDREDRYQTVAELADELQRFLDDEPILARPLNPLQRYARRARRRPALAAGLSLGALTLLVVLGWGGNTLREFYVRQNQIDNAAVYIANAMGQEEQLSDLHADGAVDEQLLTQLVGNLEQAADSALQAAPGYAQAEYYKGRVDMWRSNYEQAHERFTRALEDDPFLEQARIYRVVAASVINDATSPEIVQDRNGFRVIAAADTAAKQRGLAAIDNDIAQIHPESAKIDLVNAVSLNIRGQFAEAIDALNRHLRTFPVDNNIRGLLQLALIAGGRYDEAIELAQQLIKNNTFVAESHANWGYALAGKGDFAGAAAQMQTSLDIQPNDDFARWLATWQAAQGDLESALVTLTEILKRNPDHRGALLSRSSIIGMLGSEDKEIQQIALADAERAVELGPDDAYAHFLLGQAALYSDPERSIREHEIAIELDAAEYQAHSAAMQAAGYFMLEQYADAISAMQRALQHHPDNRNWTMMLARFQYMAEQYDNSLHTMAPYIAADDAEALYLELMALEATGQVQAFAERAARLVELHPAEPAYRLTLARALIQNGRAAEAAAELDNIERSQADDEAVQADVAYLRGLLDGG